jgi:hypothetical protein
LHLWECLPCRCWLGWWDHNWVQALDDCWHHGVMVTPVPCKTSWCFFSLAYVILAVHLFFSSLLFLCRFLFLSWL